MILKIDRSSSLKSIQSDFNAYYPFLKIEFFKQIPSHHLLYKTDSYSISESRKYLEGFYDGIAMIDISRKRSVTAVEKELEKILGLTARVFRKSGNVWVETTLTNEWSLGEANEEGKQISSHFN